VEKAWLALGANLGNPEAQLGEAIRHLQAHPKIEIVKRSAIIVSPPWGKKDQNDFHNMVIEVATSLKPTALLLAGLAIEDKMGRERLEVWGPRVIDIDIIAFDRYEIKTARLTLPHPYAHSRDFVLEPLREVAPEVAEWVTLVANKPR